MNLSRQEINRLNRQDRIILVDDASIFSEQALESMRDHVSTIIIKSKAPSFVSKLPFSLVNAKDVILEERENFAVIGKASLEKQKERADILHKIVAEYKEARNVQL
jgi:hypothetical protein